jgi:hypothetical protein
VKTSTNVDKYAHTDAIAIAIMKEEEENYDVRTKVCVDAAAEAEKAFERMATKGKIEPSKLNGFFQELAKQCGTSLTAIDLGRLLFGHANAVKQGIDHNMLQEMCESKVFRSVFDFRSPRTCKSARALPAPAIPPRKGGVKLSVLASAASGRKKALLREQIQRELLTYALQPSLPSNHRAGASTSGHKGVRILPASREYELIKQLVGKRQTRLD